MLGCDHTQIAFSGVALTSGFGCSSKVGQDVQYFRLKNYNHTSDNPQVPWNFSYTPKIVVINLGQNDQCGSEPNDTMQASYESFVRNIRAKFPKAQIVALRPFGGPFETPIHQAITALNAAGDHRVYYVDTTGWLDKPDFADGVHPNAQGLVKIEARLDSDPQAAADGAVRFPALNRRASKANPRLRGQRTQFLAREGGDLNFKARGFSPVNISPQK